MALDIEKIRNHPFFVKTHEAMEQSAKAGRQMTDEEAAAQVTQNLLPARSKNDSVTSARAYKSE